MPGMLPSSVVAAQGDDRGIACCWDPEFYMVLLLV